MSRPTPIARPLGYSGDERSHTTREMDEAQKKRDTARPPDLSWLYANLQPVKPKEKP